MEDAHLGGRRPSHPMLLNRGASYGPFRISMHDLGDLVLHSFDVSGSLPAVVAELRRGMAAGDDRGTDPLTQDA
jgi:hypothetical protein